MHCSVVVLCLVVCAESIRVPVVWDNYEVNPAATSKTAGAHLNGWTEVNNKRLHKSISERQQAKDGHGLNNSPINVHQFRPPTKSSKLYKKVHKKAFKNSPTPSNPIVATSLGQGLWHQFLNGQDNINFGSDFNSPVQLTQESKWIDHSNLPWTSNIENSLLNNDATLQNTIIPINDAPNVPKGSVLREHIVVEPDLTLNAGSDAGIPTRPIYPGEGVWAKFGSKHKPYIKKASPIIPLNKTNPEGIHVFNNQAENFDKLKEDFENDFGQISPGNEAAEEPTSASEENEETEQENKEEDFIPLKTYSQVRKYENEEHLPASVLEPRLREVIRDSKIHTVYTEEGYEDVGYDHAGHEKHAEQNEGEEQEHDNSKPSSDSDAEGTTYTDPSSKSNFTKTAISTTSELNGNGTGEYEVFGKIKVKMSAPNTSPEISFEKTYKEHPKHVFYSHHPFSLTDEEKIDQKTAQSIMEDINKHIASSSALHSRKKRFTNDFPDITVDTSFIGKFSSEENINTQTTEKYPYYKMNNIPEHSALRYAQDMETIPIKEEGKMVIYNQNSDVPCEDFPEDVNPIPKHIEEMDKTGVKTNETSTKAIEPNGPRLRNLGDKIDCFKERYFGENPLDSPIFYEEKVEAPTPIFEDLSEMQITATSIKHDDKQNILSDNKQHFPTKLNYEKDADSEVETSNGSNSNRILPLLRKPKELHLNTEILRRSDDLNLTHSDTPTDNNTELLPEKLALRFKVIRMRKHPRITMRTDKLNVRYHQPYPSPSTNYQATSISPKPKTISEVFYKDEIKPSEQLNVFADVINNIKNSSLLEEEENGPIHLSNVQKSRLQYNEEKVKPRLPIGENFMQAFFQTSTERAKPSPPNENNYYSSPTSVPLVTSKYHELDNNKRKYPAYKVYENLPDDRSKISKKRLRYSVSSGSKSLSLEPNQHRQGNIIKRNPPSASFHSNQYIDDNDEFAHRGTFNTKVSHPSHSTADLKINKYLVPGMRPPSIGEKRFVYEEYKMKSPQTITKRFSMYPQHERSKRSASRLSYSEIRRPQSSKITEEEKKVVADEDDSVEDDDDYVPHRPKTYHYDPETDKIVYTKTTTEIPIESLEEVEYEDEEDEPETKTKKPPKATTLRTIYHKDVLNQANGPTLVDFLAKLRSDPSYEVITDPAPTEKPVSTSTTTVNPEKTTPPAFLGFLEKLHKNKEYVKIEDEDEASKKNTKTVASSTVSPIEDDDEEKEDDEEEEEDTLPENVQNAPGGQFTNSGGLQLFDISEYLPQSKNYSPRTTIDYSKYKTIDRGTAPKRPQEDENTAQESQEIPKRRQPLQEATSIRPRTTSIETTTVVENKMSSQRISFRNNVSLQNRRRRITTPKPVHTENRREGSIYPEEKDAIEISTTPESTITTNKPPTTRTTSTTTTKKPNTSIRIRKRPSTTRPIVVTTSENSQKSTESSSSLQSDTAASTTHHPIPRVYPRRPKPAQKIRLRTTTPSEKDNIEEISDEPHSRPQRKLNDHYNQVPANHKAFYTPIIVEDRMDYVDNDYIEMKKQPRPITDDIIHYNITPSAKLNNDQTKSKKIDVEVFKEYDKEKRHGGNYVKETNKGNKRGDKVMHQLISIRRRPLKVPENIRKENNSDKKIDTKRSDSEESKTRIPFIIKDPSKRLYYYAPI